MCANSIADSTIPLGESPQKDITRADRDPAVAGTKDREEICKGAVGDAARRLMRVE